MSEAKQLSPTEVIKALKCGVCWGYFNKPHTLKCGHSFCMSFLVRHVGRPCAFDIFCNDTHVSTLPFKNMSTTGKRREIK
uniref:RING-type domain-containing protein n=1 Tax=Magallana gigas TaxID=29159 RepID=K1QTI4_MAGGI